MNKRTRIEWTPEQVALLGKNTDMTVAAMLGCSHKTIVDKRKELGIPPLHKRTPTVINWTPEMDAHLGTDTDSAVAEKLGLSSWQVTLRRRKLKIARAGEETLGARVTIDAELMVKINALEPHLVQKYAAMGVPIRRLEPAQIIEAAVVYMTEQMNQGRLR